MPLSYHVLALILNILILLKKYLKKKETKQNIKNLIIF